MAEEREPKVAEAYRALGAEAPPRAADEAILAAARRAVSAHPAPLVAPTGRRAWFVPLAAAAVLVLAVAVTLHVQLEQTGGEAVSVPAGRAPAPASPAAVQPEAQMKAAETAQREREAERIARADAPARSPARLETQKTPASAEPKPFAADSAAASAPRLAKARPEGAAEPMGGLVSAPELSRRDLEEVRDRQAAAERAASVAAERTASVAASPAAPAAPAAGAAAARPMQQPSVRESVAKRAGEAADTPEKELERIALLRSGGKHEEADKALAEFRKRYPDFRIPAPMLERVERR